MKRLQHRLRLPLHDAQERFGGAFGLAAALFPVLQGATAHAQEGGEARLGEAEALANGFHVGRGVPEDPRGFASSSPDFSSLLDALAESFEIRVVHWAR